MRDGSGKLDVSHTFSSYFRAGNFYAALIADNALIAYSFVLTAMAFPVLCRSENPFAEKTVSFGFLRTVVDCFGLRNFAVRPASDFFGRSYADLN